MNDHWPLTTGMYGCTESSLHRIAAEAHGDAGASAGGGLASAERMAFHLLKGSREDALALSDAIRAVKDQVRHCSICFNLTEGDPCSICADAGRDHCVICVVEQPKDLLQL